MKKHLLVVIALIALVGFTSSVYSQAAKRVLMENLTSSTCPPCASNNPQLYAWAQSHWAQGLVSISYHMNWPSPGNDPMYAHNPTQNTERRSYYGVNSIPYGILMGIHTYIGSPFPFSNMNTYFDLYNGQATPTSLDLVDTRFSNNDSNRADVTVINLSTLPAGNYNLKVYVVESMITNINPPATNGETQFPYVFRLALPTTAGTNIPMAPGTYTYQFKYKINTAWVNNQIYTIAFIQNDNDRTIVNATRNGLLTGGVIEPGGTPTSYALAQTKQNPFNRSTNIKFNLPKNEQVTLKIYDMLGNEVKTLVEGVQQAGSYNIFVDGSNLASGVYFYTLRTSSFIDTKKMILIK